MQDEIIALGSKLPLTGMKLQILGLKIIIVNMHGPFISCPLKGGLTEPPEHPLAMGLNMSMGTSSGNLAYIPHTGKITENFGP